MIIGAHSIINSTSPESDRAFLRDVLKLPNVDVGEGWLIFGLPPAEVAIHPSDRNDVREFYLMCDDVQAFVAEMQQRNIYCGRCRTRAGACSRRLRCPAADGSAFISLGTRGRKR